MKASYIGSKIFEAVDVCKRFDQLKITDHFNYVFARYEKMGIVGNNGTGKSTFIKMLMGEVQPDSGHFDVEKRFVLAITAKTVCSLTNR